MGEGWSVDDPIPVNAASTERFLRLVFSLSSGSALIPENLVQDFGPANYQAGQAVRALYFTFHTSKEPLVKKLYDQWRVFFSEATDYKEWAEHIEGKPEFRKFVASLWPKEEIKTLSAGPVFFVLHTYYALLIKLVASLAAARFAGESLADFAQLAAKPGEELHRACMDLEAGGLFRQYGIRNFLLNPLAVIAARTNYLLALGDLLKARQGDIDIPVYQADSVLTPSRPYVAGKNQNFSLAFEGDIYRLRTAVGEFDVPAFFASRGAWTSWPMCWTIACRRVCQTKPFLNGLKKSGTCRDHVFAERIMS